MKFVLIKERKTPADRRVVLTPGTCAQLKKRFPDFDIAVEASELRIFSDDEYRQAGIEVVNDAADGDVLLGVKEVPVESLIPEKKYFFFSHTIKKQAHNQKLLRAMLDKNIGFYDHEVITNKKGIRLVSFGYYAGIVGAYQAIRTWGLKTDSLALPLAHKLTDKKDLIKTLNEVSLAPLKILVTGTGRVGRGVTEILDAAGIEKVNTEEYLNKAFNQPVYCAIDVLDYNKRKDGSEGGMQDFFDFPGRYESNFFRFAKVTDLYITAHFHAAKAPAIITKTEAAHPDFNIKAIADISCDLNGPIASTLRASATANPIYGYHRSKKKEVSFKDENTIAVMAVDNLPSELPRDASEGFSQAFAEHVIPSFFNNDDEGILNRALMTKNGILTPDFKYLQDYANGF